MVDSDSIQKNMNSVERYLQSHGVEYVRYEHPAVFTCEDAEKHCLLLPGLACKNLFLKSRKGDRYFVYTLPASARADLKQFASRVGADAVRFGSAEELMCMLQVEPGSVSPFGVVYDAEGKVELCIDVRVYSANMVTFHPNTNTASLLLTHDMFAKYLATLQCAIRIILR